MSLSIEPAPGGARFHVAARPNAGRSAIQGVHDGALKVAIGAAAEKGKANKELLAFLAKQLGLRKTELELTAGETGRKKTLQAALGADELRARLEALL